MGIANLYHRLQCTEAIEQEVWVHLLLEQLKLGAQVVGFYLFQFHTDKLGHIALVEQEQEHVDGQVDEDAPEFIHQHHGAELIMREDKLVQDDKQNHETETNQQAHQQSPVEKTPGHLQTGKPGQLIQVVIPHEQRKNKCNG